MTDSARKSLIKRPATCDLLGKPETISSACSSSVQAPASKQCTTTGGHAAARHRLNALDSELLQLVHDLGAYPRRFKNPAYDVQCRENALAMKITKRWKQLSKDTQQELRDLQTKNTQSQEKDRVQTLINAVRTFGRWPREHAVTEDPKLEEEGKLARSIRDALHAARPFS